MGSRLKGIYIGNRTLRLRQVRHRWALLGSGPRAVCVEQRLPGNPGQREWSQADRKVQKTEDNMDLNYSIGRLSFYLRLWRTELWSNLSSAPVLSISTWMVMDMN